MTKRVYVSVSLALFGLVLFYSSYKLTESPPTWYDEGIYIQVAESIALHGTQALEITPTSSANTAHVTAGFPLLFPVAASLKFLGPSLFAARVPMVIFILLCAVAAWGLILKLFGVREAIFSLLLLATFPLLYGNGKNVLGEVPGMLYTIVALYCLWKIELNEYREVKWYILAGLCIGLAAATKPIFLLLPAAIVIIFLLRIRSTPLYWGYIGVGSVSTTAPLLVWAYLQFFGGSAGGESYSVFSHYFNPYAEVSLSATILHNTFRFFTESTPLYCAALFGAWLISLAYRVYKNQEISNTERVAFTFSLLILLTYLRTEGWYRYFFEAMLLSLVFLPSSLYSIARHFRFQQFVWVPILLLGVMQFYQLNFSSWVAEHYKSTGAKEAASFFSTISAERTVYVYNTPDAAIFLPNQNYYQYLEPIDRVKYGTETLPLLLNGVPDYVVVSPNQYEAHRELFTSYRTTQTAGPYLVLEKN